MIEISILYSPYFGNQTPHMEYPGARFTRPVRLTLLITFIAAFFIISPIVVLYAAGFHYDWQNGFLRETGGLSIDVLPTKTTVFVDGLPLNETLPIRLKNITPKNYHIELHAIGYHSWEKDVTVYPRQTTYLKDITLLKKSEPKTITSDITNTLSVSKDGRYVIFSKPENKLQTFFIYDQKTNQTNIIAGLATTSTLEATWNQSDTFAIADAKPPYNSFIVGKATNPSTLTDVAAISAEPITKYIWKNSNDALLYLGTSSTLFSFSPLLHQKQTIAINTFQDWYITDNTLWTLNNTTNTAVITRDTLGFNEQFAAINTTTSGIASEQFDPSAWKIATISNGHVLLQHTTNPRMLIVEKNKQYNLNTHNFLISPYNNWWLMHNDSEIWSYIEDGDEGPSILLRSGELVKDVVPLDNFNTLGLHYNRSVHVLFPYEYVEEKILNEDIQNMVADTVKRTLFYSTDKGLFSLGY